MSLVCEAKISTIDTKNLDFLKVSTLLIFWIIFFLSWTYPFLNPPHLALQSAKFVWNRPSSSKNKYGRTDGRTIGDQKSSFYSAKLSLKKYRGYIAGEILRFQSCLEEGESQVFFLTPNEKNLFPFCH